MLNVDSLKRGIVIGPILKQAAVWIFINTWNWIN